MTPVQVRFVELEKKKDAIKAYYEELETAMKALAEEVGVGGFFQDGEGIVYQVVVPEYKTIKIDHLSYIRTKRSNESRGSLSVKKAEEAGYTIKK